MLSFRETFNDGLAIEVSLTISYGVNDELENIDLSGRTGKPTENLSQVSRSNFSEQNQAVPGYSHVNI